MSRMTLLIKAGSLLTLALLVWCAGTAGVGKYLTVRAERTNEMSSADAAVRISPGDADAYLARATLRASRGDLPGLISEIERAVSLRPDDYVIWLNLARAQELNGHPGEAIAAARRAVVLAPFYAQPHWQLGNILIRAGQTEEGFRELAAAGRADSSLLPSIINLAWQLSRGDKEQLKRSIQPISPEVAIAAGEYLGKQGAVAEALEMLQAAGSGANAITARQKYVGQLIDSKNFDEALALWNFDRKAEDQVNPGEVLNPSFEQESNLGEISFGWRAPNPSPKVRLSLDSTLPKDGRSSLLIEFGGDSNAANAIVSQLIVVAPKTAYTLRLACRTEQLVSGALPNVMVLDATDNRILAQTGALPTTTTGWREYQMDFTTSHSGRAIRIVVQRQQCTNSPCPIFGRLWLDDISLSASSQSS